MSIKHHKLLGFSIFVLCLSVLVLSNISHVLSQDVTPEISRSAFRLLDGRVTLFNPISGSEQTLISDLLALEDFSPQSGTEQSTRIFSAGIDPAGQFLYLNETSGRDENGWPLTSRLVQLDVTSGQTQIVLEQSAISNFVISPDGQRIIISYFSGPFENSSRMMCYLSIESSMCSQALMEEAGTVSGYAKWISDQEFLTLVAQEDPIRIVNTSTGTTRTVNLSEEWYVNATSPIPNSQHILLSALNRILDTDDYRFRFLTYNLTDDTLQELPYRAIRYNDYESITDVRFSPDGRYLMYFGSNIALVEFANGRLIQEFEIVISSGWLDNETLLVQGSRDGLTLEIFTLNAATGVVTQLSRDEQAGGILLVPGS